MDKKSSMTNALLRDLLSGGTGLVSAANLARMGGRRIVVGMLDRATEDRAAAMARQIKRLLVARNAADVRSHQLLAVLGHDAHPPVAVPLDGDLDVT